MLFSFKPSQKAIAYLWNTADFNYKHLWCNYYIFVSIHVHIYCKQCTVTLIQRFKINAAKIDSVRKHLCTDADALLLDALPDRNRVQCERSNPLTWAWENTHHIRTANGVMWTWRYGLPFIQCLRVLSHLVRLSGPNQSSFVPPSPCPRWTAFIYFIWVRTAVRLLHQASSCLPPLLSTTAQEEGAKCIRLLSALYIFTFLNRSFLFTKLQCIKPLMSCLTNVLLMLWGTLKANRNETYSSLLAVRQSRSSGKWVKHTNTHFY